MYYKTAGRSKQAARTGIYVFNASNFFIELIHYAIETEHPMMKGGCQETLKIIVKEKLTEEQIAEIKKDFSFYD